MRWRDIILLGAVLAFLGLSYCLDRPPPGLATPSIPTEETAHDAR